MLTSATVNFQRAVSILAPIWRISLQTVETKWIEQEAHSQVQDLFVDLRYGTYGDQESKFSSFPLSVEISSWCEADVKA